MTIFSESFGTRDVLVAADISNDLLQAWIRRDLIVGHKVGGDAAKVDMPGRQGIKRTFTYFNVVEIAVAAALAKGGLDLKQAFRAAAHFAHMGDRGRRPGMPFADGETFIGVAGERSYEFVWSQKGIEEARHYLGARTFTFLDASAVVDRVLAALGRRPQEEIDLAYQGSA